MVSKKIKIIDEQGLHMRPATVFSQTMAGFKSNIQVKHNEKSYDAKSVMMLMTACIKCGDEIEIVADGSDEQDALQKAIDILEKGIEN